MRRFCVFLVFVILGAGFIRGILWGFAEISGNSFDKFRKTIVPITS